MGFPCIIILPISEQLLYQNRAIDFPDFWLIHYVTVKYAFGLFVALKAYNLHLYDLELFEISMAHIMET